MFSYKFYISTINLFLENNYRFLSFKSQEYSEKKIIYLRHDVDNTDIRSVLNLAKIDNMCNVNSIFFFQPNAELYNMFSKECMAIIERVVEMGHEIGLHIDASIFSSIEELGNYINNTYNYYSLYFPLTNIISYHRPASFILNSDITIEGYINVYQEKFFKRIKYFSDSNRREFWKQKDFLSSIENNDSIQFLTHPAWWSEKEMSAHDVFLNYSKELEQYKDDVLSNNVGVFKKIISGEIK